LLSLCMRHPVKPVGIVLFGAVSWCVRVCYWLLGFAAYGFVASIR
jgi:uncharacterized membrane protein YuzA (DUF378 family)